MAYNSVRSSNQWLRLTATPLSASPFTMAICGYTGGTNGGRIFVLQDASSGSAAHAGFLAYSGAGDQPIAGFTNSWFDAKNAISVAPLPKNQWFHIALKSTTTSSRSIYIDGGSSVTNSTDTDTVSISGSDYITIGGFAYSNGSTYEMFDGFTAEAAIWSDTLTDDELVSLAKGFSPRRIRPQKLVFYAPLVRNRTDLKGGGTLSTSSSAPTVANHPRVY